MKNKKCLTYAIILILLGVIIAPTIMAKYIVGIIGIRFNIVVRYIDATPVIPVATDNSRINLFDLTLFPSFTLKML